jgi:MiaB-like tRNA modifying enzyme
MQIFVRSFGCSANTADSEALKGCLAQAGYPIAPTENNADIIIYNTCAVKGPTENRIIDALKQIPKTKKIIVTGCLPLISYERLAREVRFDAVIGPAAGKNIVQIVQRVLNGESVIELQGALTSKPQLNLPKIATNPAISIITVNFGCLGSCAYCCVVQARGHLRSCSPQEITERIKQDTANGVKEFWLTSQDTAAYGKDLGTNLAMLLKTIAAMEGDFRVRVGMMTPNLVVPFLGDFVEAFGSEKIFKFVHLPVQSGDDGVLRSMRRFYTAQEYKTVVTAFKAAYPEITISTDVIVGFPGETETAFQNTLNLIEETKPDIVNVSKFFARPKTPAWNMRDNVVDKSIIKRRSAEAALLAKEVALRQNQRWVGWEGEILVDEKGKASGSWVGRNFAYKPIAVKSRANLFGKQVQVKVEKAFATHLLGTQKQANQTDC